MRATTALTTLAAGAAALTLAAGPAAAIAVDQIPGGTRVELNHGEASAVADWNLGPAIGSLPPNYTPHGKYVLGQTIAEGAQQAKETNSQLNLYILGPVTAPSGVGVSVGDPAAG
ncbi:hypothetical protein IU433_02415 [Nocardia puris]|uniref:Uncharacterized protein n=1 Tax=Nocardia puris TaxID=208602 RepID=A0A366DVE7_9NOCA|nr:hypothetical protein [Nocardia puris]MBF6210639.1 hypothetical protein [Nocardia puris]MBF6369365.1 hypothetical protein [Nocardia puris]MBF6457900.1 hypothetical protein [Nocardia puris]RBO94070.1 hypothetical protein DFR74_102490 [Nocardia puris]